MGLNADEECVVFLGSEEACKNVVPCGASTFLQFVKPVYDGRSFWCYGADEFGQCHLYLGTEQSCASLSPCVFSLERAG
jgi:hypothetical protein